MRDYTKNRYCGDHPKYKAIHKPRTDCVPCWYLYTDTRTTIAINLQGGPRRVSKIGG